jgi:hypothetical protein
MINRTASLIGIAALFLATVVAHAVEIPKQYRGEWCQTKWQTIYKRCPSGDFLVDRIPRGCAQAIPPPVLW